MKSSRWLKIGAGLLTGSVLSLIPLATAQAADLNDSLKELTDSRSMGTMHSPDAGKGMGMGMDSPSYGTQEWYGAQGPVRTDMDKEQMGMTSAPPSPSMWDKLRKQLGPIGSD